MRPAASNVCKELGAPLSGVVAVLLLACALDPNGNQSATVMFFLVFQAGYISRIIQDDTGGSALRYRNGGLVPIWFTTGDPTPRRHGPVDRNLPAVTTSAPMPAVSPPKEET